MSTHSLIAWSISWIWLPLRTGRKSRPPQSVGDDTPASASIVVARVLRFGVFELDPDSGELRRHRLKIRFPDQSFQILKNPAEPSGRRDDARRASARALDGGDVRQFRVGLNSAVRKLREALDNSAENPRFVETLPRRGYRFVGAVTAPTPDPTPRLEPAAEQASVPVSEPRARRAPYQGGASA